MPRKLYLHGQAEHGAHDEARVKAFDEAETLVAYKALYTASPQRFITRPFTMTTMSLQKQARQIPLTKSVLEVFSED